MSYSIVFSAETAERSVNIHNRVFIKLIINTYLAGLMDVEEEYEPRGRGKKIRIRVVTNRGIKFVTSVRQDATVSDFANRALSVYLELAGQLLPAPIRKQLTVSAVKQGVFYMPKSQQVANLMSKDDQVEVVIIKAKPKYPQQMFQEEHLARKNKSRKQVQQEHCPEQPLFKECVSAEEQQPGAISDKSAEQIEKRQNVGVLEESKRLKKKEKKRMKMEMKKEVEQCKSHQKIANSEAKIDIQKPEPFKRQESTKDARGSIEQISFENIPKKKIKACKEDVLKTQERSMTKIGASPKITFHSQPKIDSPQVGFVLDNKKKQGQQMKGKNIIEENEKGFSLEAVLSPGGILKSPQSQIHKTPLQLSLPNQNSKGKEKQKEQLSNFSLSRKGSEDKKRVECNIRKNAEEKVQNSSNKFEHLYSIQHGMKSPKNASPINKSTCVYEAKLNQKPIKEFKQPEQKVKKSLIVLEPPSESDSEEKKQVQIFTHQSARATELMELKSRIRSFAISSEEEPDFH